MSFFYRKPDAAVDSRWNPTMMRVLTTAPLVLYPVGCVWRLLTGNVEGFDWGELLAVSPLLLSLVCFVLVAPSYLQRLVGEQRAELDEFEMDLRRRAYTFSYHVLASIAIIGAFYLFLVTDAEKAELGVATDSLRALGGNHVGRDPVRDADPDSLSRLDAEAG